MEQQTSGKTISGKTISGKTTQSTTKPTKPTSVKTLRKSLVQSLNKSLRRKAKAPKVMANLNNNVLVDTFDSSISLPLLGANVGATEGVWRGEQMSCHCSGNDSGDGSGNSLAQYAEIQGNIDVALLQRAIQLGLVEADYQQQQQQHQDASEVITQVLLTDVSLNRLSNEMPTRIDQTLALLARYEGSGQCLYQHWLIKLADKHYLWYQHYQQHCQQKPVDDSALDAAEIDEKRMALIGARIAEIYTGLIKG